MSMAALRLGWRLGCVLSACCLRAAWRVPHAACRPWRCWLRLDDAPAHRSEERGRVLNEREGRLDMVPCLALAPSAHLRPHCPDCAHTFAAGDVCSWSCRGAEAICTGMRGRAHMRIARKGLRNLLTAACSVTGAQGEQALLRRSEEVDTRVCTPRRMLPRRQGFPFASPAYGNLNCAVSLSLSSLSSHSRGRMPANKQQTL